MKYIWEESDIIPGRGVLKVKVSKVGQMRSYVITYGPWFKENNYEGRYFLVLVDEDGMSLKPSTKAELADMLNKMEAIPAEIMEPRSKAGEIDSGYGKFRELVSAFKLFNRIDR